MNIKTLIITILLPILTASCVASSFSRPIDFSNQYQSGEKYMNIRLSFIDAKDEDEAIRIANDSRFGLAGGVFTKDIEHGLDIAMNKIHTGTCYVNGYVASDPRLPFGGIKFSGYGRELSSDGIHEFMNTKTICIKN